jgi:hypothetical protein
MSTVHHLLKSAIDLQDETHSKLHALHVPVEQHFHAENINPNSNRFRSMWQAAYITVSTKLRHQKLQRAEWDRCVIVCMCGYTPTVQCIIRRSFFTLTITISYVAVLWCAMLCLLCCVVPCSAVLHCAVMYYAVSCFAVMYYAVLHVTE